MFSKNNAIRNLVALSALMMGYSAATPAYGIFLDGEGYYSLLGSTETSPGITSDRGMYQAIRQNFRLLGEARLNEKSSVFLEFRVFDRNGGYFGDTAQPRRCNPGYTVVTNDDGSKTYQPDTSCDGRPQDTGEPGYAPYQPKITQLYARYAFEYCLLDAGRRGRDWGMGLFLSSGKGPFDRDSSVFDGVTCNINFQKAQTLAFSVGIDKLQESGGDLSNPFNLPAPSTTPPNDDATRERRDYMNRRGYGSPNKNSDDLEQFFFTIEFDDRKANAGASFTKDIGFYFANVVGHDGGTDIKFLDLYTGFFLTDLVFRNEIIFRLGKTVDPNWVRLGGRYEVNGDDATKLDPNKLQSIGFGGQVDFTITRSGSFIGPAEYNKGDATRHAIVFDYAYAPGDANGYRPVEDVKDSSGNVALSHRDSSNIKAMAFHQNYKPALIMFNGNPELADLRVDGIYDPDRVMNATLFGLGYRYESITAGNFDVKFLTATLDQKIPDDVKDYYTTKDQRPQGFAGRALGYEMDLKYTKSIGKDLDLGAAAGVLLPGKGWQTQKDSAVSNDMMLQSSVAFKF